MRPVTVISLNRPHRVNTSSWIRSVLIIGQPHPVCIIPIHLNRGTKSRRIHNIRYRAPRNEAQQHCSSPRQLSRCKSQSSMSSVHQQVQRETSTSVSSQQSNAHRTGGPHLYNPLPSQLTSTEPRTGAGRPALQPPRITGRSQSEDTNNTEAGGHKHPAYWIQTAPIPAVQRPYS